MLPSQVATGKAASASDLLADAAARAQRYLAGLDGRSVAPAPQALAALAQLDLPLPEGPSDPAGILDRLDRIVSPATMAMAGPRFFGFVIGGSLPVTVAANWLATAWDQNAGLYGDHGWHGTRRRGCPALAAGRAATCRANAPVASSPARRLRT